MPHIKQCSLYYFVSIIIKIQPVVSCTIRKYNRHPMMYELNIRCSISCQDCCKYRELFFASDFGATIENMLYKATCGAFFDAKIRRFW